MNLCEALASVQAGKTVTRRDPDWTSRGLTWGPNGMHNPHVASEPDAGAFFEVMLMGEDIFAEDWEIVP